MIVDGDVDPITNMNKLSFSGLSYQSKGIASPKS